MARSPEQRGRDRLPVPARRLLVGLAIIIFAVLLLAQVLPLVR